MGLLSPLASTMKLDGGSNFSLEVDAPHHGTMLTDMTLNTKDLLQIQDVFARSEEVQRQSMDQISKFMTLPRALELFEKNAIGKTPALKQIAGLLSSKQNLRKQLQSHDGFGGVDGARRLLNDMIHEVHVKYDQEISKCTSYYSSQCALMETARGHISAANYVAANSRMLILDSQAIINRCEVAIPETKLGLKNHLQKCKSEQRKMNARLKVILGDISIMTMILDMTDCDKKFLQTGKLRMLKCKDECSNKPYVTFNHKSLQRQVGLLKSKGAQDLISSTFSDLFNGDESEGSVQLMQVEGSEYMTPVLDKTSMLQAAQDPTSSANTTGAKTQFNNPPVPRTKVPSDPCTDPYKGAPGPAVKQAAKCTIKKSPQCYKLQGRFLQIQAEIADARDVLMEEVSKLQDSCEETKKTMEKSIQNDEALLSSAQTKMGTAMEKEATAGETGRQIAKENQQLNTDLVKQMKTCSKNYVDYETEMCALRKIRGELYKKMKPGHTGFFQDCEVSKWKAEECSKRCAGGTQRLTRSIMTHANGGSKCLPLVAERSCNLGACPVNCVLSSWSGWSKCSAKCGGGVQNRVRDVKVPMQHGGKPCGETGESVACNIAACEKDCVLHAWTRWTACSKHCDGGSKKRERMILEPAEGAGKCADKWNPERLEYLACNKHRCEVPDPKLVMKCNRSMDIVLALDGTPRSGKKGFAAEIKAANLFVDAFQGDGITAKPNFAVVHYTGPRTWSGVSKCTGMSTKKVNMEKVCKIKLAQHFSGDLKKLRSKINGLEFLPGSKLLSLALMTVESELALGDKNHRTVVVVFIDGQPLSFRKTLLAARSLRKKARLVFVAVSKFSPLKDLKKWSSRRWQENLVVVDNKKMLEKPETGTHIVANICPRVFPKLKAARIGDNGELPPLD